MDEKFNIIPDSYNNLRQKEINRKFINFCDKGNLAAIIYVLTSSDLNRRPDIYAQNEVALQRIIENHYVELMRFLVFDYNLKKTKHIDYLLNSNSGEEVEKMKNMFAIRDLNDSLKNELISNQTKIKQNKI